MDVWELQVEIDVTKFIFVSHQEESIFNEFKVSFFEQGESIKHFWEPVYMIRESPKKYTDFFEFYNNDLIAISQKARDRLDPLFGDKVELLPIETDAGKYYTLNVLNEIDCLDKDESKFAATPNGTIVSYTTLEFNQQKIGRNIIFKIPELPYTVFVTDEFQDICEENYLKGLLFDPDTNLIWYPG